jgi:pimeloyl-ACP methyl ester carboxylesterase
MLDGLGKTIGAVVERIASGDHAGAAEQFVEMVALGPGTWAQLPPDLQRTFIENAPTFLDEARDPDQLAFDLAWIRAFSRPSLLTRGDQSPPIFAPVVAKVADVLPNASVFTFQGAGHIPHATHPDAYTEAIGAFIRTHSRCVSERHTPLTTCRRSPRTKASTVAIAMRSMLEAASGVL